MLTELEDDNLVFFAGYLRHLLTRYDDKFMKTKYSSFARSAGIIPLGRDFLIRMRQDISKRGLSRTRGFSLHPSKKPFE